MYVPVVLSHVKLSGGREGGSARQPGKLAIIMTSKKLPTSCPVLEAATGLR